VSILSELRGIQDTLNTERLKTFGDYATHPHFTDVDTEDQRKHLSKAAQLEPGPKLATFLCPSAAV
ncbi:hypothetical protein ACQP3F_31360, partial [Escherichia coli]